MAYNRKPLYQFSSASDTGIDKVPLKRVVVVEDSNEQYIKDNNTGLTASSTVQDAIDNGNLVLITGGSGNGFNVRYINGNDSPSANDLLVCETLGSTLTTGNTAYTITLPASQSNGDIILIMDGSGNAQNRPLLVDGNGNNIDGVADNLTCDVNYFDIKLVFNSGNWSLGGK